MSSSEAGQFVALRPLAEGTGVTVDNQVRIAVGRSLIDQIDCFPDIEEVLPENGNVQWRGQLSSRISSPRG